ncbi:hypothetical protein CCACVL1_01993 [Corchorus capsularis]|uniref:Receptor-like serine/threonine-protein kinase n=1 Tax=Corchorus capsularis TaxID=210143 RepID=A0A1R3KDQ4_COCAP|nr:hypothetical protein CCACVL1_01993 [Corchorus capsularis]
MVIGRKTDFVEAFLITLLISASSLLITAQNITYPSVAYPPNSWSNIPNLSFNSGRVRPILITGIFVCGFHCGVHDCLFAVSIFPANYTLSPRVVWSANRNNPVENGASLQLSENGDLMLQDADGSPIWNTKTSGKFVSRLELTGQGNLVLYDRNNKTVWQSFDHPTDTLVPGQALVSGQKLTADLSISNSSSGLYSLALVNDSLIAFVEPDAQQVYFGPLRLKTYEPGQPKALYLNGSFDPFVLPSTSSLQFIKLESDGYLMAYAYQFSESRWTWTVSDLFSNYIGPCGFPCGEYGLCSDGNCTCPRAGGNDSTQVYHDKGDSYSLLELKDFDINFSPHFESSANRKQCKDACLKNCSCKAAIYREQKINSSGHCSLLPRIYAFERYDENDSTRGYKSIAYIKVQSPTTSGGARRRRIIVLVLGSTLGVILLIPIVVVGMFFLQRNNRNSKDDREEYEKLERIRFTRFSYHNLGAVTDNFSVKLGEGGFGSVYYGSLPDSTKIAVKRLDRTGHIDKSFLAEAETLRSVNHVNLVNLIGFCAEDSHRLLVYEYMQNGSLDRWIFSRNQESTLTWKLRQSIILDVAKGLAYLHDGCNLKILHLDIKPQNILLDENFKACLADFGLSKLIGVDQNQVLTTMRGTPGYMAPEWSSATITEKVDVYSFGIVVLEILCGRRNVDRCQPEGEMHLLNVFKKKAEEGKLMELVDKISEEMDSDGAEIMKMVRLAAWCLQADYSRRPSMPIVVKVLEGDLDVEENLNFDFSNMQAPPIARNAAAPSNRVTSTSLLPSILSGPR